MGLSRRLLAALILVSGPTCAAAQSATPAQIAAAPAANPQFDVAAIHLHEPQPHERSHIVSENGSFTTVNEDLRSILQWAFNLPETRIVEGPSWLDSARWDIEAKADNALDTLKDYDRAAARLEKQRMVQSLLVDRFHLTVHQETRAMPIYILVVARSGPKFLGAKADGNKFDRWNNRIEIEGGESTVAVLAEQLAETLGRVVIDKTGIAGRYKIELNWTPDSAPAASSNDSAANSGPSIFTALEEQLGLKLESTKGPVQVLVIDHAEMPSAN